MAEISANEQSTIIFFGSHDGFSPRMILRTSEMESASSFSGINTATTIYPTLERTHRKNSGNAYLKKFKNVVCPSVLP